MRSPGIGRAAREQDAVEESERRDAATSSIAALPKQDPWQGCWPSFRSFSIVNLPRGLWLRRDGSDTWDLFPPDWPRVFDPAADWTRAEAFEA